MNQAIRKPCPQARTHDYLYDSAFIVCGAKDYARNAFKAAMNSAQLSIQPIFRSMFSNSRHCSRLHVVYHPNCRLPSHIDKSYSSYVQNVRHRDCVPKPETAGRDLYKFTACPRQVLKITTSTPHFPLPPTSPLNSITPDKPKNRGTQSVYRESSAQTTPWQPDLGPVTGTSMHEELYLDKLHWGPGDPYRTGDLPADFHTTEIINKMRHARAWTEVTDKMSKVPRWMKKRADIIVDVETKDWIFREAEIDELQDIRLCLLNKLQETQRTEQLTKIGVKLAKRWDAKKAEMDLKIKAIRRSRDREIRKLRAQMSCGGKKGLVQMSRASRAMGDVTKSVNTPDTPVYAPIARYGYHARGRHATITYNPALLNIEDHKILSQPPKWLETCATDLKKSCSGHHLQRDKLKMCERYTKWSEEFLANLHKDLKNARLGTSILNLGPLHVLKAKERFVPRPATPQVDSVPDKIESNHQQALVLQRVIRGRAVQYLMYEGRTRAAELTEELKTTHGLQKEDRARIAKEEAKAREYNVVRSEHEVREDAIAALVEDVCGGAVAAALDFLEKELRRLKDQRAMHAFVLIAIREKQMREAAEAGRRQKEEHRRREHDEMFKQALGVTQETVEAYLQEIISEGIDLGAEIEAVQRAKKKADATDKEINEFDGKSTAEQCELVAELVQQFLLPEVHKTASQMHVQAVQKAKLNAARDAIFGLLESAKQESDEMCPICLIPKHICKCVGVHAPRPVVTTSRDDWRWKAIKGKHEEAKTVDQRFPIQNEIRCSLNDLINDVVVESRRRHAEVDLLTFELDQKIKENFEIMMDVGDMINECLQLALGEKERPPKRKPYRHYSRRFRCDALARSEPYYKQPCGPELPSEIRQRHEAEFLSSLKGLCLCVDPEGDVKDHNSNIAFSGAGHKSVAYQLQGQMSLLPSQLRTFDEMWQCKCDRSLATSPDVSLEHTESSAQNLSAEQLSQDARESSDSGDDVEE